jgi:hypothetical protein
MESIMSFVGQVGVGVVWFLLTIVIVKIVWNLMLPFAVLRLPKGQEVSTLPIIEVVPLLIATFVSWSIGCEGVLAPSRILFYGMGAIALSYVHFFTVLMLGGLWKQKSDSHSSGKEHKS